jgi:hypothetical protein
VSTRKFGDWRAEIWEVGKGREVSFLGRWRGRKDGKGKEEKK